MPNQKVGIETPQSAAPRAMLSQIESFFAAARMPAGIPMARANTVDSKASSSVTGSFCEIKCRTVSWLRSDSPRLPVNASPAQRRNCSGSGSSR